MTSVLIPTDVYMSLQSARYTDPMLAQCWTIVCDAGPTLSQHWGSVSCLLGYIMAYYLIWHIGHEALRPCPAS